AVVDSGIDGTATEFRGRLSAFYDFTNGGQSTAATDAYGHGTHVAALIGANSLMFAGIAPNVHLVGVKVLDANGQGKTSDLVAALDFLVANKQKLNIQIVNLSLGHPILEPAATDPLVVAVERAVAAGLVVVTSAGNYGENPTTGVAGYAGNAPSAITAGSLDLHGTAARSDDTVSPFSSRGPTWYDGLVKPDILAPGHGLFGVAAAGSTLETSNTAKLSSSGADIKLFGTSMVAATTTGVVALALEINRRGFPDAGRDLPPNALKAMLQYSSVAVMDPVAGVEYDLLTQGAGGLNALGAISLAGPLTRLRRSAPGGSPRPSKSARSSAGRPCRGRAASSGAIRCSSDRPSTATPRPGRPTSRGATRSSGARTSSCRTRSSGAIRSCGATRSSGARVSTVTTTTTIATIATIATSDQVPLVARAPVYQEAAPPGKVPR
ncbi:MAG TPA: S8 family serine peptidase, partial [Vicinamibacterales bacterium]|nr:S8 family serine peptidase [Vicinamibacterales bacterium]